MTKIISFDELQIGQEIPPVIMHVTAEKIWRFADASKDYNPLHINPEWIKNYQFGKTRLRDIIGHGLLTYTLMTRAVTDWVWLLGGQHHRLEVRFNSPVYPGDIIHTEARVREKKVSGTKKFVVFDITVINQEGAVVSEGRAMESLP